VSKMQTASSSNLQQWVIRTPGGNTGVTSIAQQLESHSLYRHASIWIVVVN